MEKVRDIKKINDVVWLKNPQDYDYVRESTYSCCSANYKPIKKGEYCTFINGNIEKKGELVLVGYTKPKRLEEPNPGGIYEGIFWWLKPYDRGMPFEKEIGAYGDFGSFNHPCEAVTFRGDLKYLLHPSRRKNEKKKQKEI